MSSLRQAPQSPLTCSVDFPDSSARQTSSSWGPGRAIIPAALRPGGDVKKVTPVTLPLGRLRLLTSPGATGSPPIANTIGIDVVAAFAASPAGVPLMAAITAT